jgi:hypothetical protein
VWGVCGVTLSMGKGEDVEQAEADVLGRAGTRKVRSRELVPRSASCPESPPNSASAAAQEPALSPSSSPSVVEKCTLQARDSTRRLDAAGRSGGGGGGSGGGGGKQLPLVRKTLPATTERGMISSLSRERVGSTGGLTMTTGIMDANGSGLTASVKPKSASPSHPSRKEYGNADLTSDAPGAESSGAEGASGRGAGGPVGRDHKDMVQRALNGNGALFRALSFGDLRGSCKGNSVNPQPSWAGLGSTKKEVKNLHYKDNDRGDKTQGGPFEHGDSGAKSHKTHDVVDTATPGLEETISFLLGRGGSSACGAMKITSVAVERTTSSEATLAAARQTLDAARHMHEERRTASWRRQDGAAPRLTRARSEEESTAARPLTANLEMMRGRHAAAGCAEDTRRQGMLIQERRGDDVSGAPRQPGAPGRMSLDSSRLTRDAHAQLELIPLSHVPHDLLVTPLADNLEEGLKPRPQAQSNKGRLRIRTEPPPQQQQGQQQQIHQQQKGMWYGRGAGAQGAQLGALVPRPPANRDSGGRGGHESVQLLLHRVSKTRLPNNPSDASQQRPYVKADNNEVLRIACSQSSSCAHVDSHLGGGGSMVGAPRGRLCTSAHGAVSYPVGGNVPGVAGLQLASKLRVLPDIALHAPGAVPQVANPPGTPAIPVRGSLPR